MNQMPSMRDLFYSHNGNQVHKWDHYFEIYQRYFNKYRGQPCTILEIGIAQGGSLQLWRKYFGEDAQLYAIDVNPDSAKVAGDATVFIGSQSDAEFLSRVASSLPDMDIIIDDGGHTMEQQRVSFEILYPKVKQGGVYLVEDTHTSYWSEFYGGLHNKNSFIEHSKHLIDSLYEHHLKDGSGIRVDDISRNINCIAFYDSVVAFEKLERPKPFHIKKGEAVIPLYAPTGQRKAGLLARARYKIFGAKQPVDKNAR